jgi:multidrug efflux pump subunit AcrA (membrane-fusion protein)
MKKLLLLLVLIPVALVAAAYWVSPSGTQNQQGYTFEHVQYGSLTEVVNVTGVALPLEITLVFPRVPGTVDEILPEAKVGQWVKVGQALAKLNSQRSQLILDRARDTLERAKGALKSAQSKRDRVKELVDKGIGGSSKDLIQADADVDTATHGVREAQTGVREAELVLEWSTVTAPVSGIIIKKEVLIGQPGLVPTAASGRGQTLLAGTGGSSSSFGMSTGGPLFIIAKNLENFEIQAQIPQSDIGRVEKNQEVKFTVDDFTEIDNPEFTGKIQEIELWPTGMPGAAFYPAKILVTNRPRPNSSGKQPNEADYWILRPVMNLSVDIVRRTHPDVWKIPKVALDFQLDDHYITPAARRKLENKEGLKNPNDWTPVWVLDRNNKPWPIFVRIGGRNAAGETGINDGNYTEILEWDPEMDVKPVARDKLSYPQVIIGAPPANQSVFDKMRIRVG